MKIIKEVNLNFNSEYLLKLLRIFANHDVKARVVGGAVRDALIGIQTNDIDIAVSTNPVETTGILEASGFKVVKTGIEHGTVTVLAPNEAFEVTTLRKDVKTFGRKAIVEFTDDFEEDATRRDFTINAMSYDCLSLELYDYFGGLDDLNQKRVRFIGDPIMRIQEDYLRILRFFRFSTYYSASLDAEGLKSCKDNVHNLKILSKERINKELSKILSCPKDISLIIASMNEIKIFEVIASEFALDITGIINLENRLWTNVSFTELNVNLMLLRLSFLIFLLGKAEGVKFLEFMKYSTSQINAFKIIISFTDEIVELQKKSNIYFEISKAWYYHTEYVGYFLLIAYILDKISIEELDVFKAKTQTLPPKLPVLAEEITNQGFTGAALGIRKKYLEKEWIRSGFSITKEELLKLK